MTPERLIIQEQALTGLALLGLENKLRPYFIARLVELEALFDHLLAKGYINPENLRKGPIIDLTTDFGSGLLALRRKTLAPLFAVGLKAPEDGVLKTAVAGFQESKVADFFTKPPFPSPSLVTITCAWYAREYDYHNWVEQIESALAPNGQLLITSEQSYMPYLNKIMPEWGQKVMDIIIDEPRSDIRLPRVLPAPTQLIEQLGGIERLHDLCNVYWQFNPFKSMFISGVYQEKDTNCLRVANFTDRNFWIFTKK